MDIRRAYLPCIFTALLTALAAQAADPNLRITEFMYNAEGADGGKEYIEIINAGPGDIPVANIKFSEHGRGHGLKIASGPATLTPGDIAVIVGKPEEFAKHYTFSGTILDSANYALNNTSSTIILTVSGKTVHTVSYTKGDGASGDGNSLHVSANDSISARSPSVGKVTGITITRGSAPTKTAKTESKDTQQPEQKTAEPESSITLMTEPEHIFIASETVFSIVHTKTKTRRGKTVTTKETPYGLWNFGDGTHTYGTAVRHTYRHPGTYIISFQEEKNSRSRDGEPVTFRKEIHTTTPQVTVGRIDDAFVKVSNNHPFILDISGWQLSSGTSSFTFPQQSFIPAEKSTIIPFTMQGDVTVTTAGGGEFSGTPPVQETVKEPPRPAPVTTAAPVQTAPPPTAEKKPETPKETEPAVVEEKETGDPKMFIVWIALLFGLIAIVTAPFLLTRAEDEEKK